MKLYDDIHAFMTENGNFMCFDNMLAIDIHISLFCKWT